VSGFAGEQFALPEAADLLRRGTSDMAQEQISVPAADSLNLVGIVTPGERVSALSSHRVLIERGMPVAMLAGAYVTGTTASH
jgi:ATP-dependent Lhr-like helicase